MPFEYIMPEPSFNSTGEFFHQDGYFYQHIGDDTWRRIECYLPAGTGTYQEPLHHTVKRYFDGLESGRIKIKRSYESGGKLFTIKNGLISRF